MWLVFACYFDVRLFVLIISCLLCLSCLFSLCCVVLLVCLLVLFRFVLPGLLAGYLRLVGLWVWVFVWRFVTRVGLFGLV